MARKSSKATTPRLRLLEDHVSQTKYILSCNLTTVTITGTKEVVERTILNLAHKQYVKITVPIANDVIEQCDVISKDRFEAVIEMKD